MLKKTIFVAGAAFAAILLVGISPEARAQTNPGLMQKAPEATPSEPEVKPEALPEKMQPKPAPSVAPPEKMQPKPAPSTAPSPLRKSAAESTPARPPSP
jgi:hypothetical protein